MESDRDRRFALAELRKEVRQYERNTENLVNTTRILSERRKL